MIHIYFDRLILCTTAEDFRVEIQLHFMNWNVKCKGFSDEADLALWETVVVEFAEMNKARARNFDWLCTIVHKLEESQDSQMITLWGEEKDE